MNKLFTCIAIFGMLFIAGNALATVGGPTYISEIAYSAKDNFLYYKVHDEGGRGCPPIVHKVDLATLKDTEIKSCTQFEEEYSYNKSGMQKYNQFIADTYNNLFYIGSVSLEKNHINIVAGFVPEKLEEYSDMVMWSDFMATLAQDGKEIGKINFRGCAKDQPHIFEGYMIPDSDKMAILISNKGDCFEGGYVKEILQVIAGVKYYDKSLVRSFKTATATEPSVGNMVVYAGSGELALQPEKISSSSKNIYAIIAVVLGLGLGYFLARKINK